MQGSSPHTRGAPAPGFSIRPGAGIIPAYAGSTPAGRSWRRTGRDHPRIRGEHRFSRSIPLSVPGSSPHTRGAHVFTEIFTLFLRDHPRIRGEHVKTAPMTAAPPGSSPHTRGALEGSSKGERVSRIIPAYAGSTSAISVRVLGHRDHPRIRGEHTRKTLTRADPAGSSPHTRGALDPRRRCIAILRIIPAYAGSTALEDRDDALHRDHPRIRGEHSATHETTLTMPGSSPHTRGALLRERAFVFPFRIIPAYAGSTWAS